MKEFNRVKDVYDWEINKDRRLFSASHEEILSGRTTDIYFVRTKELLEHLNRSEKEVTAEVFASREGVMAGTNEVMGLIKDKPDLEVWTLKEGENFGEKEVIMRLKGPYSQVAVYETPLLGILASSSGWASAASECREAAGEDATLICFGARHIHPSSAPVMERSALVGGFDGCSCILGAKLWGIKPSGTVPHAVFLMVGDTVEVAKAYNEIMPENDARVILVDTFKDEVEESLRVARELGKDLFGVRIDTPSERGGVTSGLIKEARAKLDQAGFDYVRILASGGMTPDKIIELKKAGVSTFGVGSYIAAARPIDMTMDLKEVDGIPIAKRGRIPGLTSTNRLSRIK
ncbi:nicotinate phosphoribosyltransferase [Natranaerofaba carboxydovora]|uniref:nicotinate phosphoribosyltransferase n=1 Tax=Natranaerofaba carboxydovora TaxID=2742683 RepID=UPI001F14126E|nr:nicotinate phosphoribosyltransferase [Natranaerofaba carboxydovora]UMZ75261.1 Nicotinate phosphoribosyltransferase pncB2 [Natranaerofaba carboxydovora]